MADVQYRPLGEEPAPAGWTLQGGLEIVPKTAYASFDGTGAAGPFVPCLRIVSDAGIVAGEYVADASVAAGGSADVSWFRGLRGGGGSSVQGGVVWAALSDTGGAINVPVGFKRGLPTAQASFYTNSPSTFAQGSHTIAGVNCAGITMLVGGHYLVQSTLQPFTHFADGTGYATGPGNNLDADESTLYQMASQRVTPAGEAAFCVTAGTGLCQTINWWNIQSLNDGFVPAPATYYPSATCISGAVSIDVNLYCVVYYLDADTTFIN